MEYSQKEQRIVKTIAWVWTFIYLAIFPIFFYGALFGGALALDFQEGTYLYVWFVSGTLLIIPCSMLVTVYSGWRRILKRNFKGINYFWLIPIVTAIVTVSFMFICL